MKGYWINLRRPGLYQTGRKFLQMTLVALLFYNPAISQVTFTSFTPTSGAVGSTVTINGSGFSATPSANIVYFGAAVATVTAASASQLSVTVPAGATYQPLSVLVTNTNNQPYKTVFSVLSFSVTFPASRTMSRTSFVPVDPLPVGGTPMYVVAADLDGDGKSELATSNSADGTISILQNTSAGSLSFASHVDAPVYIYIPPPEDSDQQGTYANYPAQLIATDLNNDGKIDIATACNDDAKVTELVNTGGLSFAASANFSVAQFPYYISSADINGDGLPDLGTAHFDIQKISVLWNQSSQAYPNYNETEANIGIVAGGIATGDVNGDQIPDIVIGDFSNNKVAIYLNHSGNDTGLILDNKVEYPTGKGPSSVVLADFDGDGKLDIATANYNDATVSVLLNTYQADQAVSFGATQSVNVGSAPQVLAAGDLNGDGLPDLAVTNNDDNSVSVIQNNSVPGTVSMTDVFDFPTGNNNNGVMIADLDGDGQPEIAVANLDDNTVTVLQNKIGQAPPSVTITQQPTDVNGCQGTPAVLSIVATGSTNLQYQWAFFVADGDSWEPITDNALFTGTSTSTLTVNTSSNSVVGQYQCTVSINDTPEATSNSAQLTIAYAPPSPVTQDSTVCMAGQVTLTASGSSDGNYRWYTSLTATSPIDGQVDGTFVTPSISTTTSYFVTVADVDDGCESPRAEVTATINIVSPPVTTGGSACSPNSLELSATDDVDHFSWYTAATGGSPIAGVTGGTYTTPALESTTTYYVSGVNGSCESTRTPVVATLTNCTTPPVIATPSLQTVVGGTVTLSLSTIITDPNNTIVLSSLEITKQPASGARATIDEEGDLSINYTGIKFAGTDSLQIKACNEAGVCATRELYVDVTGSLEIYNGISPDGNGLNDTWVIKNIDLLPDAQVNHVSIYNRWGDLVFDIDNYDNSSHVFSGVGNSGSDLPPGTYFYKIRFSSDKEQPRNGFLEIRR